MTSTTHPSSLPPPPAPSLALSLITSNNDRLIIPIHQGYSDDNYLGGKDVDGAVSDSNVASSSASVSIQQQQQQNISSTTPHHSKPKNMVLKFHFGRPLLSLDASLNTTTASVQQESTTTTSDATNNPPQNPPPQNSDLPQYNVYANLKPKLHFPILPRHNKVSRHHFSLKYSHNLQNQPTCEIIVYSKNGLYLNGAKVVPQKTTTTTTTTTQSSDDSTTSPCTSLSLKSGDSIRIGNVWSAVYYDPQDTWEQLLEGYSPDSTTAEESQTPPFALQLQQYLTDPSIGYKLTLSQWKDLLKQSVQEPLQELHKNLITIMRNGIRRSLIFYSDALYTTDHYNHSGALGSYDDLRDATEDLFHHSELLREIEKLDQHQKEYGEWVRLNDNMEPIIEKRSLTTVCTGKGGGLTIGSAGTMHGGASGGSSHSGSSGGKGSSGGSKREARQKLSKEEKEKQEAERKRLQAQYTKPDLSYIEMIVTAMKEREDKVMSLQDVYKWIEDKYPYFKYSDSGWKSSVRHNMSSSEAFEKLPQAEGVRKAVYKLNVEKAEKQAKSRADKRERANKRKRKLAEEKQRKKRKRSTAAQEKEDDGDESAGTRTTTTRRRSRKKNPANEEQPSNMFKVITFTNLRRQEQPAATGTVQPPVQQHEQAPPGHGVMLSGSAQQDQVPFSYAPQQQNTDQHYHQRDTTSFSMGAPFDPYHGHPAVVNHTPADGGMAPSGGERPWQPFGGVSSSSSSNQPSFAFPPSNTNANFSVYSSPPRVSQQSRQVHSHDEYDDHFQNEQE